MVPSQIAYMQREAELYAEFGRANANDALPLIKKHGLAGIEHHLIGLVGRRWARVPAEDIEPLRIAVVDPVRLEYAQTKKAMAGTSFNTMTITGGRKYEAALTGIYYSDGDFLFVEAAVVDGKRYPGLAYYSVDGSEGFFKPKDDQAGN